VAGIPPEAQFAVKPRQARAMIAQAIAAGVSLGRFTADGPTGRPSGCRPGWKTRTCPMWWPSGAATRWPRPRVSSEPMR